MSSRYYDIIIIGSGISGLYSAYNIKNISPSTSFLILEKYKKNWIGGRTSNEQFYGTEIVTGAGIGRKNKDKLLHKLLTELQFHLPEYTVKPHYSKMMERVDVKKVMTHLRKEYKKFEDQHVTFKEFATKVLGEKLYKKFIISAGYTDYENEDAFETLYYYGMEDNACCWTAFRVPWKKMVMKLYHDIGSRHFRFSSEVIGIQRLQETPCKFQINIENGTYYLCNRVIIASTIDTIKNLLPGYAIYNHIKGQPFLRLYAKFTKKSAEIMKEYVKGFTFVPGPLQRIIPMDPDNGVYMIAYNDNANALVLKDYLKNTRENRELYETLLERSLGIPENSLHIVAIKDFYWSIGTHFFSPLDKTYSSREEFIHRAQHPENGILVVGEAVSRNQGWSEGSLESVKAVLTKKWITSEC
jgi:thioredoxin reductase